MSWTCPQCGSDVEDNVALCWRCGTGPRGEPPPDGWHPEHLGPADGSMRAPGCLRCATPMTFVGLREFQTGSYAKEVVLGEFFMHYERMEMYRCDSCGKLEFFAAADKTDG